MTGVVLAAAARALKPPPQLSPSEWGRRYRIVSAKESPEYPGPYDPSRTPYLIEIMDNLGPASPVMRTNAVKGSQTGLTDAAQVVIGHRIWMGSGGIMVVQPNLDMARRFSKFRIDPMVQSCPELRSRVAEKKARDGANTSVEKEFRGGFLILAGANSADGLRSVPVVLLVGDEIDTYPEDVENEGDPWELAEVRTRTVTRRKILQFSSPTWDGRSRAQKAFLEGDQRRYFVPCPACGVLDHLSFRRNGKHHLVWPKGRPEDAQYECPHCTERWPRAALLGAMAGAEWRPTYDPKTHVPRARTRSYHLSGLISTLGADTWAEMAERWEKAQGNPEKLRVFVNTWLGETWKDQGAAPAWAKLYRRRELYRVGTVPARGLALSAGVDVQADRIEATIRAWGPRMESWVIRHDVYPGSTDQVALDQADDPDQVSAYAALSALLREEFPHELGGTLRLEALAIDSGYNSNVVYSWARLCGSPLVHVVKGSDNQAVFLGQPSYVDVDHAGRKIKRGVRLWSLGVGVAKTELYGWLKLPRPGGKDEEEGKGFPAGFVHFPQLGEEWFKQLTAEARVARKNKRGFVVVTWEKTRERNEALDCMVYSQAAAGILGIERWPIEEWERRRAELDPDAPRPAAPAARRRSDFWKRRR